MRRRTRRAGILPTIAQGSDAQIGGGQNAHPTEAVEQIWNTSCIHCQEVGA